MREILFRGKDIKGNWHIGLLANIGNAWYISNKAGVSTAFEVIPETVGQYTGLTDKNGKKIFEGDIVNFKTTAYHFKNCRIKYQSCYARYCAIDNKGYEYPMDKAFEYEVISIIHDNPELLKSEVEGE